MRYQDAGVNIDAANRAKRRIKQLARRTFNPRVLREVGAFGGFFALDGLPRDAVLVSSVDGSGLSSGSPSLWANIPRWAPIW